MGLFALFTRGTSVYTIAVEDEKETAMARINGWTLCFSASLLPGFRYLRSSRLWRSVPNALRLVEPKDSHQTSHNPINDKARTGRALAFMAEKEGFEPSIRY